MSRRGAGCGCWGCGGTVLTVLGALALAAWIFVVQPAQEFLAGWRTPPAQTRTLPEGGNANAPLTRSDVEKFVRVRREVRRALGTSFSDLQQLWQDIQAGQTPNLLQLGSVLRQTAGDIGAARAKQAEMLTRENMSAERYAVVRSAVNRALGLPSVDLAQAAGALQQGQLPDLQTTVQTATPQEKVLVTPFERELRASAPAGLLGL